MTAGRESIVGVGGVGVGASAGAGVRVGVRASVGGRTCVGVAPLGAWCVIQGFVSMRPSSISLMPSATSRPTGTTPVRAYSSPVFTFLRDSRCSVM